MRYSRTELHWAAPTQNTDGTPIDYELDYELGVDETPIVTIVGNLQEDSTFRAPLDLMSFEPGTYALALRAINRDQPNFVSTWSSTVPLEVLADPIPAAPVLYVD